MRTLLESLEKSRESAIINYSMRWEKIMDKLQSGRCELTEDELKFIADLYEKHSKALLKYATIILDKQNGEEAVQNVFWIL